MTDGKSKKGAVVLFNLGGPDGPAAIAPFLFNLFNDPAIIAAPAPIRWLIAKMISRKRAPVAAEIYQHLGGKSPLLDLTRRQADALKGALNAVDGDTHWEVFIAMRYWHPMSGAVARAVKSYGADEVVLLPLYPQYSTTTTGSSVRDWMKAARRAKLTAPHRGLCCYPDNAGLVAAQAKLIGAALADAEHHANGAPVRVLYSAHGLPKKVIAAGDPYQAQVEATAAAITRALGMENLDTQVCYQSRVGPLAWIGPSTEDEIRRAGRDGVALVVVPVAFVSEHSETLVELDIEYAEVARDAGVRVYRRVPAVGTEPDFISGLAGLVAARGAIGAGSCAAPAGPGAACAGFSKCPFGEKI